MEIERLGAYRKTGNILAKRSNLTSKKRAAGVRRKKGKVGKWERKTGSFLIGNLQQNTSVSLFPSFPFFLFLHF